jgi:hypothetical protein
MKTRLILWLAFLAAGWLVAEAGAQVLPRSGATGGSTVVTPGAGGFVQRPLGTDQQGRPIPGTVYQAGSRQRMEWRRSARGGWYAGGGLRYRSSGAHGIVRGGYHSPGAWWGGGVWQVNDAGFCYPAAWRASGMPAWPLMVNPGFGGGLTIVVSF